MTDKPKMGFLCTGKNPLELSVSVHCAYKLMEILRDAGFATGSCYTEIFSDTTERIIQRAAGTLSHLCISNDLVITVGCEGFDEADIIPDITDAVCRKKATYFSNVLCGSLKICAKNNNNAGMPQELEQKTRLFPDDDDVNFHNTQSLKTQPCFEDKQSFSSKLDKALYKFSAKITSRATTVDVDKLTHKDVAKIMTRPSNINFTYDQEHACRSHNKHYFKKANRYFPGVKETGDDSAVHKEFSKSCCDTSYIEILPSRATSGIYEKSLILNTSNDVYTTLPLISALLPEIGFVVYNISGKSAPCAVQCENFLKTSFNFQEFFKKQVVVND